MIADEGERISYIIGQSVEHLKKKNKLYKIL
jgi:hypothetical protein